MGQTWLTMELYKPKLCGIETLIIQTENPMLLIQLRTQSQISRNPA